MNLIKLTAEERLLIALALHGLAMEEPRLIDRIWQLAKRIGIDPELTDLSQSWIAYSGRKQ